MSSLTVDQEQKWVPTHVQVTVLRARSLRGKGKHGTSDVYAIIQLGKEKYSTCVVEKTTAPEWREECTFELQPGVLESGSAAASNQLILTVMHQALMGLDLFLGQAVVPLGKVFSESRCLKNEWYQLKSKTGKKEKERGDIQVTVQFTRDNLTASMYDLVMKDKSMSTFGKLKERMRGKRRSSEEDSSSAVLPGGYGSLCRMRQRLPSEGGGEEDYEDDEGGEMRRSKMRTFFLRGKLRKSSDTRSSTSLGSESSESSSRGGSLSPTAGISVVVSDLSNSPSNSSNLTTDNSPGEIRHPPSFHPPSAPSGAEHTANLSPRSPSSLQCEFGDEAGEVSIAVPAPGRSYGRPPPDPGSGRLPACVGLAPLHRSLPVSTSLQNLSPRAFTDPATGPAGDGRRWSFDKPGEEEKAAIAAALEQSGSVLGGDELQRRLGRAEAACEGESQGKKQKKSTLSHGSSAGKGPNQGAEPEQTATAEEKHKGWFGSKDPRSKPRFCFVLRAVFAGFRALSPVAQGLEPIERTNDPHATPTDSARIRSDTRSDGTVRAEERPLPPTPTPSNPFAEPDSQWDDSFEAFAAGRLQPSQGLTAEAGKPSSSSPDPASSGIGSSVEEDFLSCLSSYSDKFSASSAEESEAQTLEADMMGFEKSWESTRKSKPWESDEDRSNEPSLLGAEHRSGEVLEGSPAPWWSPGATRHQPVAAARLQPKSKENERREGFHLSAEGFPAAEVVVSAPPDVLEPAFHIRTSSPESDSRFLRSLYVSSDSQHYQTCESLWPSGCSGSSEPDQTLRGCLLTAAQELFPDAPVPPLEETLPRRSLECSPRGFGLKDGCGPHPVRPLLNNTQAEEKRTEGRSVLATGLEKLKSTIHPGRSSQLSEQDSERKKVRCGAGSYYHLNHSELVALLVQREAELEEQKEEFKRQKSLLAKREVELKKLKPQVKDLEDYIDTLLVRIMEQKPTLLQVR
ncbi:unnamed protein product, partial [Tetraodon nigroviridis]